MRHASRPPENDVWGKPVPQPDIAGRPTLVNAAISPSTHVSNKRFLSGWSLRHKVILFSCLGLLALVIGIASPLVEQNYTAKDKALAQNGVRQLQMAEMLLKKLTQGSLDTHTITQAQQDFAQAFASFSQVKNDVEQIPGIAASVPGDGSLLSSAQKLVPLALEASQAGIIACKALTIVIEHLHGSLNAGSQGITMGDLTTVKNDVAQLQQILNQAEGQINQLQPSDLQVDAHLGRAVTAFRTELPGLRTGLQDMQSLLDVAPSLLGIGQPASFLIEQLDSTEIRPGGGFIGNYGIATFSGGRLAHIQLQDTYLLDNAFQNSGHSIPYPPAYTWFSLAKSSWSLRDSNLDADFPTSARYGEQLYHTEGGTVPLQGAIAITPWFIENALKITGPIYVPEYQETVTAQNIVDRIHFHQLQEALKAGDVPSPDGHSSLRKRFTEILFEHFFERMHQIAPTAMPQFVSLLYASLQTKDIQIYINAQAGEKVLQHYQVASVIQTPASDSLFVVDANVQSNKANNFMTYTLQDQVTIDTTGNAIHHTTLTYNWPYSQDNLENDYGHVEKYVDYVRLYIPPGSTLLAQAGWNSQSTSTAFHRDVLAGVFTLPYGQTGKISLTWEVHGAATHDASGWHYRYLIQRQAGITWHLSLPITLPACTHSVHASNKLAFNNGNSRIVNQDLTKDLNVNV
ncbi:MAG TPA: DUF4012 domain-containing protein, partial [Ktedonobacteraceae bacterium]|nr:DUF4012 domain-containing protein [Ktedonobacteraceae bacterium]